MIKRWSTIVVLVFAAGFLCSPAVAKSKKRCENVPVYYLSLGTSLAAGVQADPSDCVSVVTDVSYPNELAILLKEDIRKLRHVNLGCPGETSESFMNGGKCDYPQGSQLDQAVQFLHGHSKFTGLITIDLGANDVLQCIEGTTIDQDCLVDKFEQLSENLFNILAELRESAPGVPIVGMNYYNPLLVYYSIDLEFAESSIGFQLSLNSMLEEIYDAYDIPVADVADAFMSYDLTPNGDDGIPESVALLCAWTWMCTPCQNIHPNDTGYNVIANEFYDVLPEIPISVPPRKRHHGPR